MADQIQGIVSGLSEEDYVIDTIGRIIITNPEIRKSLKDYTTVEADGGIVIEPKGFNAYKCECPAL